MISNNKLLLVVIGAIGLYAVFLAISDFNTVANHLSKFNFLYLPLILSLVPCGWFALYMRWILLLKKSGINVPWKENLKIYLAGFALAITPGKAGELVKSQLLKTKFDIPYSKTAPIVLVERLYDLVGAIAASAIGMLMWGIGGYVIGIASALIIIVFVLISSRNLFDKVVSIFGKFKFARRFVLPISESYDVVKASSSGKIVFYASALTFVDWMLESLGIYFVLQSFGINSINYLDLVSTYASSLVIGALSFIPGGLGIAEVSLVGLFSLQGISVSFGLALVVVIRIFTLWYSVVVGFIALKMSGGFSLKLQSN